MRQSDDAPTVIAIGVLAATLAAVCHETLGHGLGCIIDGGRITLLTSIWFRCRGATALTDAAGPIGSLVAGLAALVVPHRHPIGRAGRLFLVMFGGISLFWFAGQLISHATLDRDDWHFVARALSWPWWWRVVCVALGVAAYLTSVWLAAMALAPTDWGFRRSVRLAYAAAVLSAVTAGLMWHPAPLRSAGEAFETIGVLPLGVFAATALAVRRPGIPDLPLARSRGWIAIGLIVFCGFLFVQGRGLGMLADRPIVP